MEFETLTGVDDGGWSDELEDVERAPWAERIEDGEGV